MAVRSGALGVGSAGQRAADRIVSWLAKRGVRRIFGIPGGAVAPLFDALVDARLDVVVCQHEAMAVYLAYGEARATGRPGVVAVTSGPGVLNTVTAVAAAYHDEVPLVVLAGEVRTDWAGRGAIQDGGPAGLDVCGVFRSVTRFADTLVQPERIDALLDRAFAAAMSHPRGPALLRLPVDRAASPVPSVPEWRSEPTTVAPDEAAVARAAALVASADRPAILAGIGVRTAGVAELVERLAYRCRIPVLTDVEGKGTLPERDALALGLAGVGQGPAVARYLAGGVDVLVTVGARLDDTSTSGFSEGLRPSRALVQIDHDARRLHRAWPADVAIAADLRATLSRLLEVVRPPSAGLVLARDAAVRDAHAGPVEVVGPLGSPPFDPRSAVVALQSAFGADAVFTSDIGNHLLFAARHLVAERRGTFHVANGLGGMGSGIGTAMGLATAYGAVRRVVGICGDGGLLMVGNELATCARYRIPVVLAVFDNQELGMVEHGMVRLYGRSGFGGVPATDLVGFARSLGATAETVVSAEHLAALAGRPLDGPLVLHLPIDPDVRAGNPREHGFLERSAHGQA